MRIENTPWDVGAIDAHAVVPTAVSAPGTARGEFVAAVVAAFSAETDEPELSLTAESGWNLYYVILLWSYSMAMKVASVKINNERN